MSGHEVSERAGARPPAGETIREAGILARAAREELARRIVGKEGAIRGILVGIGCSGHVLLEGVPGLAKTLAVKSFAEISGLGFSRIQFTPDLLPADVTGSPIFDQGSGRLIPRRGPVFANVVLADEINRAPAKVQSALLEAMEEGQVTMGDESLRLPEPFFVLATQNPIEHEGTYPLPEAQLDRFMLKIELGYPSLAEELAVVGGNADRSREPLRQVFDAEGVALLRRAVESVRVDEALAAYIVRLVRATRPRREERSVLPALPGPEGPSARRAREAGSLGAAGSRGSAAQSPGAAPAPESRREEELARQVARWLEFGASPRAAIHLFRAARAFALLEGRDYVLPEDVKAAAPEVLRHRLVMSYQAEAEGVGPDAVLEALLGAVPLP